MFFTGHFQSIFKTAVDKIAQYEGNASLPCGIVVLPQSLGNIGAPALRHEGEQFPHNVQHMVAALFWGDEFFNLISKKYHAHFVVVADSRK